MEVFNGQWSPNKEAVHQLQGLAGLLIQSDMGSLSQVKIDNEIARLKAAFKRCKISNSEAQALLDGDWNEDNLEKNFLSLKKIFYQ